MERLERPVGTVPAWLDDDRALGAAIRSTIQADPVLRQQVETETAAYLGRQAEAAADQDEHLARYLLWLLLGLGLLYLIAVTIYATALGLG